VFYLWDQLQRRRRFSHGTVGKRSTVVILRRAWGSASPEADPETPIAHPFPAFLRSPNYAPTLSREVQRELSVTGRTERKKREEISRISCNCFTSSFAAFSRRMLGHRLLISEFLHLRCRSLNRK
jgi:hypothetical protein